MQLIENMQGNYKFLTGIAPYSSGVVAMPGYEIVNVTFHNPLPYQQGFIAVEQYLNRQNRSRQALCAVTLRSPKPFTFEGFADFNGEYQELLANWDVIVEGKNPIARTNVVPVLQAPDEPILYAFSYTRPTDDGDSPTFVVAGAGDLVEGELSPDKIVRDGETSTDALQEKAAYVMSMMEARLNGLGVAWPSVTIANIYTARALQPYLESTILEPLLTSALHGVRWFFSTPPIQGLEFEMDVRAIRHEVHLINLDVKDKF